MLLESVNCWLRVVGNGSFIDCNNNDGYGFRVVSICCVHLHHIERMALSIIMVCAVIDGCFVSSTVSSTDTKRRNIYDEMDTGIVGLCLDFVLLEFYIYLKLSSKVKNLVFRLMI